VRNGHCCVEVKVPFSGRRSPLDLRALNVLFLISNLVEISTTINDVELVHMGPKNHFKKVMNTHYQLNKTVSSENGSLRVLVQYSIPGVTIKTQEINLEFKVTHTCGEENLKATSIFF